MFSDRIDAGQRLSTALAKYKNKKDTVVIALPRGGIVPAYIIARELNLPLDVAMVKKIGHPSNPEYAIGAASLSGKIINGHVGVSQEYIDDKVSSIQQLLRKRYKMYHGDNAPIDLHDKIVIVVDDGIATGRTMVAALQLIQKEEPRKIIAAVPVGPTETIDKLENYADKVVCLETYENFYAIGAYYDDFSQVSDEEVKMFLNKANKTESFQSE